MTTPDSAAHEAPESEDVGEDTIDLGRHLDPARSLLRRLVAGEVDAAHSLIVLLSPRIHGLALEVTASTAAAERLTISVLASALEDAEELASGDLPGDVTILDRARRMIMADRAAFRATGDVRSIVAASSAAPERTKGARELAVIRALVAMPPRRRALLERAALGRFPAVDDHQRREATTELTLGLAAVGGHSSEDAVGRLDALATLDALALSTEAEREELRVLEHVEGAAARRRRALESAAALTLLTSHSGFRDLVDDVLEAIRPATYTGTYDTPVLGTDAHRRQVGPPAQVGSLIDPDRSVSPTGTPDETASLAPGSGAQEPAPRTLSFEPGDQRAHDRKRERISRRRPRLERAVLGLGLVATLVLGALLVLSEQRREDAVAAEQSWSRLAVSEGAVPIEGRSDNGTWRAITSPEGTVLEAHGVMPYEGEVLQLWAEQDGQVTSLGILEVDRNGRVSFHSPAGGERLVVTREHEPGAASGTPSARVVADLTP